MFFEMTEDWLHKWDSGLQVSNIYQCLFLQFGYIMIKFEKNEMGWACGAYGWGVGVYRVLVGKPEGKRTLGRPRRRWVDNVRMDLQEVGCGYMDWIGLAQDRDRWRTLASAVMNLWVPWNVENFLTSCKPVSFSRRTLHHGVSKYVHLLVCYLNKFIIVFHIYNTTGCPLQKQNLITGSCVDRK